MSFFIIKDSMACKVTWSYRVEAANEAEAFREFVDGQKELVGEPEIGDAIEFVQYELECEEER